MEAISAREQAIAMEQIKEKILKSTLQVGICSGILKGQGLGTH